MRSIPFNAENKAEKKAEKKRKTSGEEGGEEVEGGECQFSENFTTEHRLNID